MDNESFLNKLIYLTDLKHLKAVKSQTNGEKGAKLLVESKNVLCASRTRHELTGVCEINISFIISSNQSPGFLVSTPRKPKNKSVRVWGVSSEQTTGPRSRRGGETAELGADFNCCQKSRRLREAFINICALRLNYASACGEKP